MQYSVTNNFPIIAAKLDTLGKQSRFATAVAMTGTAQDVRAAEQQEMQRVFDRPTRYTLNSLYVQTATKTRLEARVWVKDSERPTHYLLPEIEGGGRAQKRFEDLLRQRGFLASGERTVPGAGAKIDAFGNMARSQIVQILSQLQAFNLAGASQNATNSTRSKAKRASVAYFYARKGETRQGRGSWKSGIKVQHLPTGIYAKTPSGIVPVLIFVTHAAYRQRLRFYDVANKAIVQRFPQRFHDAYAKALATAKWTPS